MERGRRWRGADFLRPGRGLPHPSLAIESSNVQDSDMEHCIAKYVSWSRHHKSN